MSILLALTAALSYGLSDFVGGAVSRRTSAWAVAFTGQLAATILSLPLALILPGMPEAADLGWAVLAGIGSGTGGAFLYRGFGRGRMGVVAPVSAVGAAVVPVLVALLTGERPSLLVWSGILAALPGIWLVSHEEGAANDGAQGGPAAGLVDGVVAGLGFGTLFAALGQVPDGAGFWPLVTTQAVGLLTVAALATALGAAWVPRDRPAWWGLVCGTLATVATVTFLLATHLGGLTVAAILTSLYPAITVLLAATVLREHIHRAQGIGLGLCGVAVALVAAG